MHPMADKLLAHGLTAGRIRRPNAFLRAMAKHPEVFFILFTIFVTFLSNYGTSQKSKPIVVPARLPKPLFSTVSSVLDLYMGDLRPLVDMLRQQDLVFVMYYAPWCAKSRAVSSQFRKAAQFLEGQVGFVAVNCWYPDGMCRKQYKFLQYPVFFAYHRSNDGYRFIGIQRAEFMVKFLEDLLHPLTLLTTEDQVQNFFTEYDTVVVGYFDFNSSPQPPGYQQFFYAAMRILEHDSNQPVKFGVVTIASLAALCHLDQPSEIVLLRFNDSTLKFPSRDNITSSKVVSWVISSRHKLPVKWLVPIGQKSLSLSREINKGPAVIMFHRVSPLSPASQSHAMFKDLALRYNQCPGDEFARSTAERWVKISAHHLIEQVRLLQSCKELKKQAPLVELDAFKCCMTVMSDRGSCHPDFNLSVCEVCRHRSLAHQFDPAACSFQRCRGSKLWCPSANSVPSNSCLNYVASYDVSSYISICCKQCHVGQSYRDLWTAPHQSSSGLHRDSSSSKATSMDRYVLESLENLPRRLCSRVAFQKSQEVFPSTVIPDFASSNLPEGFVGRGCRANHSLSFISLDSQNHWTFAQSLGMNISQAHTSPVVVIFDKKREEQLILKEKFSKRNTALFILNFTKGLVKRELRMLPSLRQDSCSSDPSLCVADLTTDTFQAAINQPKDVVLLVYATWCGFCAALSHVYLHLAHYFHTSPNITFVRINGENNDVPWEYSMESYPTIVFFPAHSKSDSVAFPDGIKPSLPNLIRFVLQHTTFTTRLHLAADVCSAKCVQENLDLCKHTLRAMRLKLHRLRSRLNSLHSRRASARVSYYHLALGKNLYSRVRDIEREVEEVKTLRDFLEKSKGKRLDRSALEDLLNDKMRSKDLFMKR